MTQESFHNNSNKIEDEMDLSKNKKKKKGKRRNWLFMAIFLLGFLVLLYPLISRLYYRMEANTQISDFQEAKDSLDPEEVQRRMGLAKAYNDSLSNAISEDPYSQKKTEEGRAYYAHMLELREKIGHVQIPKIDIDIPIYAGTSEEVLQKGAGHLEGTSLPIGGNSTHTVITAHSGLPKARLFTDLKELKLGDRFYIHNIEGVLAYEVDQILVIDPCNFSDLLIVPAHDYATLLTCTPIMINTHRLLVRGHRVPYDDSLDKRIISDSISAFKYRYLFFGAIGLNIALLAWIFHLRKKRRQLEKKRKILKMELGKVAGPTGPLSNGDNGVDHEKE